MLLTVLVVPAGCKKEPQQPAPPEAVASDVTTTVEQTFCPVMAAPINKNIFTEYKGKRVYFCCPGCKDKFRADPEKYVAKLSQFKD